jgi:hypothetical protein
MISEVARSVKVESGDEGKSLDALRRQRFLVVGLARNCEKHIRTDVMKLRSALGGLPNVSWLVVESDSSDGTVQALERLCGEISTFRYLSLGTLRKSVPLRTERIAYCRNRYLAELRENPAYADIDYLVVADLDGMNDAVTAEAILSCWRRGGWDVCTANQRGPYYDVWTLRHRAWSPNDCFEQHRFLTRLGTGSESALASAVFSRMLRIPEDADWIEVDSAFGGLAIYRRQAIGDAKYVGLNSEGYEVSDHVAFHESLKRSGAKIFINPRLINTGYTEHTRHFRILGYVKRKLKLYGKAIVVGVAGNSGLRRIKNLVAHKNA